MSYKFLPYTRALRCLNVIKSSRELYSTEIPVPCENSTAFKAENEPSKIERTKNFSANNDAGSFSVSKNFRVPERSLVFDKNCDTFGTLSSDRIMRRAVETGDEEDDDTVDEVTYLDGIEGKTRLKPVNYAMMIKHLLNQNKLAEALSVLEDTMLKDHRAKPDMYIYNLLISGCARLGYTKKAFQLFNQMKKRSILPRLSTYTSLFNACANGPWDHDSLKRASHLRELMIEKGVQPNVMNYNAMIKAFGRHGDLETSFSIMDEMISKKMAIDSSTFNFLLQSAVSDKEAGFRHALLVWRKMLTKKILPNTFTFNLLLRTVRDCGIGDPESTKELIKMLSSSEQKYVTEPSEVETMEPSKSLASIESPNLLLPTPHQGSLISITSDLSKPWHRLVLLGSVKGVLAIMDESKAKADIKTFTLLLDIIPNSDEVEKTLLNEMKARKIKLDIDFLNLLIRKRYRSSRFKSGMEVLEIIREERLVPNIVTYGVLAMGCNTYSSIKKLIKDIDSVGFRPNVQILTVFLRKARVSLDIDIVLFTIHTLLSEGVIPDQKFYSNLVEFRDVLLFNLESKENNKPYMKTIDKEGYSEKVSKLISAMEIVASKIKDPADIHPWAQFKLPTKTVNS